MSQSASLAMSKPGRVFLAIAVLFVCVLIVAMMIRTLDYQAMLTHGVETSADDEAPRIPLPAGPKRFP